MIFISFKDIKYDSWENTLKAFAALFSDVYKKYLYLLESSSMLEVEKVEFNKILNKQGDEVSLSKAISNLMEYLYRYHNKKIMLFIDEYDVPIQEGYIRNYYDKIIAFERNLLSEALKDNNNLQKAMITGILILNETPMLNGIGVSDHHKSKAFGCLLKESIFSGLNNLSAASITGYEFSDKFGFTESDIEDILKYFNVEQEVKAIKEWYNGYIFGNSTIYNPWSIVNYIEKPLEGLKPHWINTSSNDLIKRLLSRSDEDVKKELEALIEGESITKVIDDNIIMTDIDETSENLWSFLLFTGYLKASKKENIDGDLVCELEIPNKEVYSFYRNIIKKWFSENISNTKYNAMLKALVTGDVKTFEYILKEFVINSISYFDISGKEPEKVYHAFVLGMVISLSNDYYVKSNRESGYGRYDVMLIPKDNSKLGVIIEFKKINEFSNDTIEFATSEALKQIDDMNYRADLLERDVKNILELAIIFKGKEVQVTKLN